jgi:hypothetical protein
LAAQSDLNVYGSILGRTLLFSPDSPRSLKLAKILEFEYGSALFCLLCIPESELMGVVSAPACPIPWLHLDQESLPFSPNILTLLDLKFSIMHLHPSRRPLLHKSYKDRAAAVVFAFCNRRQYLSTLSRVSLVQIDICYEPFSLTFPINRSDLVSNILHMEYGALVHQVLTRDCSVSYTSYMKREEWCMVAHCSNMQDLSRRTIPRRLTGHCTTIISSPLLLLLALLHWNRHNTALTMLTLSLPHTSTSIKMPDTETPTGHRTTITSAL